MLRAMRKHARYFYVLFFIIIITFVFWGVGTVDKTGNVVNVVEVGPYKITVEEYWKAYDRIFRLYKEVYKDAFDEKMVKEMNLKEKVLDSLIDERVLLVAAKDTGITVSNEELQDSISHEPAFMQNGAFSKDVYLNRLRLSRITPEVYESLKRQELTVDKMKRLIELSADVTTIDAELPQTAGSEQSINTIKQAMMSDKRGRAVKSFIEGYKKLIKIKIDRKLLE
ncbi:MAG TPA: SurA N-terminal domain-containing protein [Thermodesulfovibrionales bacterium]|nr:SurA N-terminal domain-containing protein [Thermodesulfovibrionales bacterium]